MKRLTDILNISKLMKTGVFIMLLCFLFPAAVFAGGACGANNPDGCPEGQKCYKIRYDITITRGGMAPDMTVHDNSVFECHTDKEIEKFGLKTFPFAIDGVALVVNPANNVSDITAQQAADIYNGKITNWKELGGTDAPITLYTREDGSGTREVFVERALNKGSIVQSANVVNSNGAMKTAVAQDKQSIGYVGIGHVDKNVKALVFDKMVPSQENASNGTYKVTRLLFMNTKGAPEGITKAFIDYIYTPEGTEIIKKSGYIPIGRQ